MATKNRRNQDGTNNSNYQKKIEELKLQAKEKELFIKSLEDELLESKEIINNQKKRIDEIEGKTNVFLSNGSSQNEILSTQYTLLAKENEEMKAKLKKTQSERDIMKKTNDKLMKQIKSGFKGDKNTQIYFDKISKENQDLHTKIIQYETQFAEKEITIKDLNQKILKYEYDLADSNRTVKNDKNNSLSKNEKEKYENKIRELEIELGKAEGQLGSLEGTIMMHEEENIMLKEENSSIKKQIDILKASKELKGNMGALRKRVAKLEQQLEDANKTNQEAQNTIDLLKKKQSDSEVNEKSAPIINNEEILGLKDKIAMLELDLEVATLGTKEKDAAIEKQEKISKDYQKKINELQKKVNDGKLLENKLMETSDKLLRAENELNILKNSSFETSETTKKYKAEQETSNKEIKKYKELSNSLKNELDRIKNDSDSLKQQIKKLEKEKELSDSKIKKADNLEKEKTEHIKEVESLKEKIKQNNIDLDRKETKIIQLTKEIEDTKTKENESIEKYEILMKKIEENQKEVVTSAKKISELTQEINDAKKKISQYENELKQANETIKKLESELKEEKNKWEESIRSREVVINDLTNQNEGDFSKLEKENKKLLDDLAKEQQALKEYQIKEQNLINEAKSFEEKLKMISIELNEKSILSADLAEQIDQLKIEQENSQKRMKESENKLIAIQEQLDTTIRERDEKLIQYNKLERQLEDNKQLLDQFKKSTTEEKDKELALAAEQIEALKKTILLQEEDLSKMEKLEKEKLIYETNIKQLKDDIEKIQNNNQSQSTTRNINEMEDQLNQLKATLELMNDELSQKNTELEIAKKAAKINEENNCELKEKIKDYEAKIEEIKNLKEKVKDYNEKNEELGRLRTTLKDYNETIEELKKLKESVKDYNEKVEELNKLREYVKDYNKKVEELSKLRESVKDYNEKVEELNKLRESVKNYNQKLEELNKMEASLTEKSKSAEAEDDKDYTDKDREIDELKTKCAELEITTLEDQLKIQELEDSLNYQQTEFESLESSWDDLKCYVGELEKEIETSHASLKEKKEKLVALESQVEIMKKKLETTLVKDTEQSSEQTGEVNPNEIKVVFTEKEICNLQPYLEKAKAKAIDKTKNDKDLSELIVLALSSQEKEIDELKLKLDQNILKFNSQNKSGSFIEDEKLRKASQDAESLREQNLQLAKELAETKSQFKAREIEVEKVTDSLFNQISTLENEFLTLEEGKNSILYDFKQYKYTVQQEMKQLLEKHSTEEERKRLELEVEQREKDQVQNSENEEKIVDDIYKIYIDKLDESLTNKDKEISNMNQTMSENQKEMDTFKVQLEELEKAHQELIQVGNNEKEITQLDPSILEEKVTYINNLEISLSDAKNRIKSYEKSQSSLMEQNKKLNDELEKAKEETRKLTVEVDDARRSETVKVIREITTYDASDSELSQGLYVCQQKLKAANKEIQELLTTINEQKKIIEKMNNELSQLRSDLEKANIENYNKQDLLNNQIINLNYKLNNAKMENQNQKKTILELEQAAARISANNINAAAEGQYPIESQTIQQYKNKIEFLQNRIESLQNEKRSEEEASKNNIDTAKARIAAMENLMIAYRNKIAESNRKALAAETQIQEQNQEIDRLYNEIDIAHSQLQEIERQVGRTIPSNVVRIQDVNESSQKQISSDSNQFIDFVNETFNQIESNPLNEENSIGKSGGYDKTMINSKPTEKNKNIGIDIDVTNNDTDTLILNKNQLENDPLIRDCMNIFSSLDDMNLNFTPDFVIEKDVDGISSSKDYNDVKLEDENKETINENKETNKEDVIESNLNEVDDGANKTKEILDINTTLEQPQKEEVKKEKISLSDSVQLPNTNEEKNNESEIVTEIPEDKETNKTYNEKRKSTLQPIAENELLSNTTIRTSKQDDVADISIIDPNESSNAIRKNKSLIGVFGKRSKKGKKTHHKTESIASEHSSISNISQATSNGKKKRTSIINFLISKN